MAGSNADSSSLSMYGTSQDRNLRFRSVLALREERDPIEFLDPTIERDHTAEPVALCGWCGRGRLDGSWMSLAQLDADLRLSERPAPPPVATASLSVISAAADRLTSPPPELTGPLAVIAPVPSDRPVSTPSKSAVTITSADVVTVLRLTSPACAETQSVRSSYPNGRSISRTSAVRACICGGTPNGLLSSADTTRPSNG